MTYGDRDEVIDSRYLQTCDVPQDALKIEPFTLLIFGGTGDLSRKKLMPIISGLFERGKLPEHFSILGFGRTGMKDNEFRNLIKESLREFYSQKYDEAVSDKFSSHLYYMPGNVGEDSTMKMLAGRLDELSTGVDKGRRNVIFYLAVPPATMPAIIHRLKDFNLCKGAKIVVEKPFGTNRETARTLNLILRDAFDEEQIYRIDHYLGKETVQNIMFFRFANSIFERLWNESDFDNVQIAAAEDIRDEKIKVVRSIRPMGSDYIDRCMVRGQYGAGKMGDATAAGYRDEDKVSPSSVTPTFFAGKFYVDNLRWAKVPFYVRAGKRLRKRVTEICLQFKPLPLRLFGRICDIMEPNALVLTIQPEEKISLRFGVKYPFSENQIWPVNMDFCYRGAFPQEHYSAYERLLIDCMKGDLTLFVREDMVEAMWEVVDPIIERWDSISPGDFPNYEAGSWGPEAADSLIKQDGRRWLTA